MAEGKHTHLKNLGILSLLVIVLLSTVCQAASDTPSALRSPALTFAEATAEESTPINRPGKLFEIGGTGEFLPPDAAFQVFVKQGSSDHLVTHWQIADGYYLYKDKISVTPGDEAKITLGTIDLPEGKEEYDEYFGNIISIDHDFQADVPIHHVAAGVVAADVIVQYQGCARAGLCYPPITRNVTVALNNGAGSTTSNAAAINPGFQSEQDRIADALASKKLWLSAVIFFGLGLLLAFTPCVLPMIPILSSIIIGQGKDISTARAFTLSLAYVLAMAATYTVAGIIVGLSGKNFQIWFQDPWVLGTFAGVFVLLSLAMFGFYELRIPASIQSRLDAIGSNRQRGSHIGAGIMGALSALIVSPCVTAPLVGALIYIAATGDAMIGGIALFALGMGMGTPLLAVGTSAGKFLPAAGAWMNTVKAVFGVLLLAVAIWLLERILPAPVILLLAGMLSIVSAIYMGALDAVGKTASGWRKLGKGLGLVLLVYGVILMIGAGSGSHSLLHPLQGITGQRAVLTSENSTPDNAHALPFQQIKGIAGLDASLRQAAKDGKPVMLDFYADWCITCKEMEAFTFSDASVQKSLRDFVLLQADVTDNDELDQALLKKLGLFGPPAILFYDGTGKELRNYRIAGFMRASKFISHVENLEQSTP